MEKSKEKKEGYFYCNKCNAVPLIHLMTKGDNLKVFTVCKCDKKLISYETFNKLFLNENKKENLLNIKEDIDNDENINIEERIKQYKELKEEINKYNLDLKNKIIDYHNKKIKEIEKLFEDIN